MGNADRRLIVQPVGLAAPRPTRLLYGMLGNRRGSRRSPVFGTIYVRRAGYAPEAEYTCACFDLSTRGIGIESAGPITVGSFVTVYLGARGPQLPARVRYCVQDADTYRAGLEFTEQAVVTR